MNPSHRLVRMPSVGPTAMLEQPDVELTDQDDVVVVRRAVAGDRPAFAELYRRYGPASYGLALRVVGDPRLAEEVVQEAFLAAWRGLAGYRPDRASVATWLLSICHHKSVDAVRREQVHRRRRDPDDLLVGRPAVGPEPAESVAARTEAVRVRDALRQLPEAQRVPLLLAYFGGHTQSEIAQLTGVPLGTVKTRMFAGLRRLRSLLEETTVEAWAGETP